MNTNTDPPVVIAVAPYRGHHLRVLRRPGAKPYVEVKNPHHDVVFLGDSPQRAKAWVRHQVALQRRALPPAPNEIEAGLMAHLRNRCLA